MALLGGCNCIRGAWFGTEAEADRRDEIFPLEMIYMVQNSGAPFVTLLGTSGALNLLRQGICGKMKNWSKQEERLTSLRVQKQRKGRKNSLSAWLFVAATEKKNISRISIKLLRLM